MRAARIHAYGAADELRVEDVPAPRLGPDDVRVEVHAASVNPVDVKIRSGGQRAVVWLSLPATLGLDLSGVVTEVGARVRGFAVGDEVFGSPSHRRMGTYAEEISVRANELARKPRNLTHLEAASLPLVGLTAWDALVEACELRAGERVLIQAGSGGVGTFAIQLAKHLGATVLTSCSPRNFELVRGLGADEVLDYRTQDFEEVAAGVDVILESVGGEAVDKALRTVRPGGRVAAITAGLPSLTARYGPALGLGMMVARTLKQALGARVRRGVRLSFVTRRPDGQVLGRIAELVEQGRIRPVVDRVFDLGAIADAHRYVETGHARGKVVVRVRPEDP